MPIMEQEGVEELRKKSLAMRRRFLEMFTELGFGHVTSAFSLTEILVALYYRTMRYRADEPLWPMRDRIVMSKGHGVGMLFPIFEDLQFLTGRELEQALRIGGEIEFLNQFYYPGFEFYGGSLGIGLGMAAGLAMGAKLNREDWLTFCIVGDAECYEGAIWEAVMFAGHNRLNNLVAIVDRNALGCSDFTENMLTLEPFTEKWEAGNWEVKSVDGHDCRKLLGALQRVRQRRSHKPLCIVADTVKGNGLEHLTNRPLMHGYMPKGDDAALAFRMLEGDGAGTV